MSGPTPEGLSTVEALRRLEADGPNTLPSRRPPSPVAMLLRQLTHFFALLLWVAVVLAAVAGLPELAVAIAVIIVINGVFAFVQEYRASRTAARLLDLMPSDATVVRDGRRARVASTEVVIGDALVVEAGDRICADGSIESADGLAVDESTLTGESVPVPRETRGEVFAGTFVAEGEAVVEVTATGGRTRLAAIAELSRQGHRPPSPLAVRLGRVVRVVALVAVGVGVGFFAITQALGTPARDGFLFAVGVTVALVPEGLLPTVTLSLAHGARRMAAQHALVRSLEAVETLGSTTYLCTDKTGTLTRNEMTVVATWTPEGIANWPTDRLDTDVPLDGGPAVARVAVAATRCSTGRMVRHDGNWRALGDPMEAALHLLALRTGADRDLLDQPPLRRVPFDPRRRRMSVVLEDDVVVKGAVDSVLDRCDRVPARAHDAAAQFAERGLRVLAVASRPRQASDADDSADVLERSLTLLGIVGLEDPPRDGAAEAVAALREAGITVAMVTGDHPVTATAIAREVGLVSDDALVVEGRELPPDLDELGRLLDRSGVVVARAVPEDKLRIAQALQRRGHVVAMTGDGVNDGPALSQADIGVALGRSGTDVAREAADLVLLDDHLATVVVAVETGRTTFLNIRKFLTYHLTDNVAELTPFVLWALSGGSFPLALGVLQILALDIGTDLLPAIALGTESSNRRVMRGPLVTDRLIDRRLMGRVFGVLGPAEAVGSMLAFTIVLVLGGWAWGEVPPPALLAVASGTAFSAVVLGQLANAFACRSATRWVGMQRVTGNRLLLWAVAVELALLMVFVGLPWFQELLGGSWPSAVGWALAVATAGLLLTADTLHKAWLAHRRRRVSRA